MDISSKLVALSEMKKYDKSVLMQISQESGIF